tara:strand:- start:2237 stop:4489 length:2253 start_codon:yes stop_codon:yes gene_type:complete
MAQTIDINGVQLEANWATEKTMQDLVDIITKSVKSDKKSGKKSGTPSAKDLNKSIAAMSKKIKQGTSDKDKESTADKKLAKEKEKRQQKFTDKISDTTASITEFDGSISNASSSLLKFAGITGIAAGAIGIAAGTIDQIIQNYTAALQAGFSFGDQLRSVRDDVARFGLNMSAVTEMLGSSGENIRRLGDTSFDSITAFVQLTDETRRLSKDFGFFGLTAGETMQELTEHMEMLRRTGLNGDALANATRDSFVELNREVLGFARITGRQRRDLLRESQLSANDIARSTFRNMSDDAVVNARTLESGLRAMGDNGDLFELVINKFNAGQEGFMHLMTQSQIDMENRYSGVGNAMDVLDNVLNDANSTELDRANALAGFYGSLESHETDFVRDMQMFSGTDMGETAKMLYRMFEEGAAMGADPARILAANNERLTEAEQNLMSLNDSMMQVQQTFMSQFFKIFGLDNIENGISQDQLDTVLDNMSIAGDKARMFVEWIIDFVGNLVGMMDTFNQSIVGDSMGGRIGMMIGEALLAKVLLTAIGTAAGTAIGGAIGAMFALTGAGSIAGAFTAGLGLLFNPVTIGLAVAGYFALDGINDENLTEAEYTGVDKAAIGIFAGALSGLATAANVANYGSNALFGTEFDTDLNTGSDFKDWAATDNGQWWLKFGNVTQPESNTDGDVPDQVVEPIMPMTSVATASPTQDGSIQTDMTPDNAWRHGDRGEEYLRQIAAAVAAQASEIARMRRAFEESQ